MNLKDYGFMPDMETEYDRGIPARIVADHRDRYEYPSLLRRAYEENSVISSSSSAPLFLFQL